MPARRIPSGSARSDRGRRAPTSTRSSRRTCRPRSRDPRRCAPKSRHRRIPGGRSGCRRGSRGSARAVRSSSSCLRSRMVRGKAGTGFLSFFRCPRSAYHAPAWSTRDEIMDKRIVVIGAGAIGGYTGGHLAHNGFDVTLIDPWPEHIETIRKDGLAIEGVSEEEFVCAKPKTMHLTELQQLAKQKPIDIAMVSVKSYDTEWATLLIGQYLAPDGYVVSLQNCMNEERIAGIVGWDKTVGVIPALLGAELYAPGRVRRTAAKGASPYEVYRVGEVHGRITKRIEELAAMIRTIDSVKATTNLWGERWSKLCVNGMANGVAAATGMSGNDMNRDDKIRRLSIRLAGEGVRVGQALGYQLEHIRMHDPETIARAGEGDRAALDEVESAILAGLNSNTRSELARPSMGQDMLKGRRTEIDFINGVIAAKGQEVGCPAPTHVKLIQAVKQVEHGKSSAKAENLYAI